LVYYGDNSRLEYDFVVKPGADPSKIKLAFSGSGFTQKMASNGDLILTTATGESVTWRKPVAYQMIDGKKSMVNGSYKIASNNQVGFDLSKYDATKPLVIDPVFDYLTYCGGTTTYPAGVTVDSSDRQVVLPAGR
jgi:hypothetical protein